MRISSKLTTKYNFHYAFLINIQVASFMLIDAFAVFLGKSSHIFPEFIKINKHQACSAWGTSYWSLLLKYDHTLQNVWFCQVIPLKVYELPQKQLPTVLYKALLDFWKTFALNNLLYFATDREENIWRCSLH